MTGTHAYRGSMIHSLDINTLEMLNDAGVVVDENGYITDFCKSFKDLDTAPASYTQLPKCDFLHPGFIDTHNHAPQWPMRGLGQGLHIMDWLEQVTFPHEARFADTAYARRTYESCVDGFLRQGITTACYYGSKHAEATCILADICHEKGQRAFIGKCNMDRNAPDYLRDTSAVESLDETAACVDHVRKLDQDLGKSLVKPVLTPRFAICCTPELLDGLGTMMKVASDLLMQTHFNEAQQEIDFTRQLFPQFQSEADLYESFGLLNERSVLAHCTIMTEFDMERLKTLDCGVAHCPIANMTVGGGFMAAPIRQLVDRGIKVGLGTDSGGGFSSSIVAAMRQAMIASNARKVMSDGKDEALSLEEVFYLATRGGAHVLNLGEQVGSFEVGKKFDAVWATLNEATATTMREEYDTLRVTFEKYVMTGDDRNISKVFVQGRCVKG